jgi:hypothetical protein
MVSLRVNKKKKTSELFMDEVEKSRALSCNVILEWQLGYDLFFCLVWPLQVEFQGKPIK